jgi:hypothetical protein
MSRIKIISHTFAVGHFLILPFLCLLILFYFIFFLFISDDENGWQYNVFAELSEQASERERERETRISHFHRVL